MSNPNTPDSAICHDDKFCIYEDGFCIHCGAVDNAELPDEFDMLAIKHDELPEPEEEGYDSSIIDDSYDNQIDN